MNEKNICIIGAGLGGLATGALLSRQGYKVEIFERETILGGRALSLSGSSLTMENYKGILSRFDMRIPFAEPSLKTIIDKQMLKDYTLDLGFHLIGGGRRSAPSKMLSNFNNSVTMMGSKIGFINEGGFSFPFLSRMDRIKILPRFIQLVTSKGSTFEKLNNVPISKTIDNYGRGKMTLALELFSRVTATVNDITKISTGETFRSLTDFIKGLIPIGYPINGLQSISKAFADVIVKNGGKINLGTSVEEIIIESDKAKGVSLKDTNHFYDAVISNVPVQDLFQIADNKCFPKDFVQNIEGLKGTGSVCAYHSLKKIDHRLLGKSFIFIERDAGINGDDAVGMIDFMTASPKARLAPRGFHLVQSYIICTPEEAKNDKISEKLRNIIDKWLEQLIPNLQDEIEWTLYPVVWHLDGVAKTIDNKKPDITTPVDNLFLVGDCVKSPGIGINCAVNSALMLENILLRSQS